jgi:hypothetical protein
VLARWAHSCRYTAELLHAPSGSRKRFRIVVYTVANMDFTMLRARAPVMTMRPDRKQRNTTCARVSGRAKGH